MDTELLSAPNAPKAGSFIVDTGPDVVSRRGEEILGLPVVKDKTWNIEAVITPSEAKAILLAMPPQRPLSAANVRYFKELIAAGRFRVTHQGIAFDKSGKLIDGMHRLTGCVEADAAIAVQVTFNMDRDFFACMDRGRTRTHADDLVTAAVTGDAKTASILAGATKILFMLDNGRVPWSSLAKFEFGASEMTAVLERHPYVFDAASFVYVQSRAFRGLGQSPASAFYTLFREANHAKADRFMEQIVRGENLRVGDAAYALREWLKYLPNAHATNVRQASMIAFVRCWNAFVSGRTLHRVSSTLRPDQTFPEISRGK